MKKIGILTFYNTTNYGALLQMYALYQTLNNAGLDTSIIRYFCEAVEKRENLKLSDAKSIKQFVRRLILKFPNLEKQKRFREFEREHFKYSNFVYSSDNIGELDNEYEEVVVGSDQVWNVHLTEGDMGFFLNGVENVKKVSYAASFGTEQLDLDTESKVAPLLKQFDSVSVREISGVDIVRKVIGENANFVLDPTFLLNSKEWDILIDKEQIVRKPYVLLYLIQNKKKTIDYARKIAEINGWEIKYVNISPYHVYGVQNIRSASPTEFLRLIKNASLVITGSYHGLALSINYSKPVYYELNSGAQNYNARISSLISTLEMEKCRLDYNCFEMPQIGYDTVQKRVSEMRKKSKEVLFSMCEGM